MLTEVARVPMPTPWGVFDVRAFESPTDHVYLAMVRGNVEHKDGVLVRLHSECLTGDALGSLRCDCGVQLRLAMRRIAAEDCGVLVYATGHEGRGVGLPQFAGDEEMPRLSVGIGSEQTPALTKTRLDIRRYKIERAHLQFADRR